MKALRRLSWSLIVLVASAHAAKLPDYIPSEHREAVQTWLDTHAQYRLALTEDCQCDEDIESIRRGPEGFWEPEPAYQPYAAVGDFDGDGLKDLVVVVVPLKAGHRALVLVFFGAPGSVPITVKTQREGSVAGLGLFARAPATTAENQSWRLLVGAFESEAEEVLIKRR